MAAPPAAASAASPTSARSLVTGAWRPYTLAFAAYTCITLAVTYPLVWHLASALPHDAGDPALSTVILWWNAHVAWLTERWWNGRAFYPAPGFLAFSDPRLGESLLAAPLQWLGLGPVAAYNVTFLATFPLSAIAAHWLGHVLTRRHATAAFAGIVYGFCPFRGAHLSHLELLAGFGMPAALAALHLFKETRRRRWLVAFAGALWVQGLCSSYYLVFFGVLVALWLAWFVRAADMARLVGVAVAAGCAAAALAPLAIGLWRVHAHYGLSRSFREVVMFSADATALVAADPGLALWGWTARWGEKEGLLFPGLTVTLVIASYGIAMWRRSRVADRWTRVSGWLLVPAVACAVIAAAGWAWGPWRIDVPGITLSSDASYKTLTLAVVFGVLSLALASPVRRAYARQSVFAFYAFAAVFLLLCALGPKPMFLGHEFLYKPPYAWLMNLPVFDSIRVPARFGMPAMLAMAAAGSVAVSRLNPRARVRPILMVVLLIGALADGWLRPIPLAALPEMWPASRADGYAAVLELPLGDLFGDLAASYRAIGHGRPTVNGSSGFEPTHYFALKTAMTEQDPSLFDWLPPSGRVLVVVDRRAASAATWGPFLAAHPRVSTLPPDGPWDFYALDPPPAPTPACREPRAPIASMSFNEQPLDPAPLADDEPSTWWATPQPQHRGDHIVIDLGREARPCGVEVAVGEFRRSYPRRLIVATSADGVQWTTVAATRTAALTIRAAIDDPRHVAFTIPLAPTVSRYVRLTLDEDHAEVPWHMTELQVLAAVATP
jgi:hypothetical protein